MKGVVLAPILAAFLLYAITGSGTAAAAGFFVTLAIAAVVIAEEFKRNVRR